MIEENIIGNLLKNMRLEQRKTQKDFGNSIVSASFYSKVEKGLSRISAEDLINILEANNINLWTFFKRLSIKEEYNYEKHKELDSEMKDAWYHNDKNKLMQIRKIVKNSSQLDKENKILMVDGWLEAMKEDEKPNLEIRKALKDKIFNISELNFDKIILFCNSMEFYDFESNLFIARQALKKFKGTKSIDVQEGILGIIANMLYLIIRENRFSYAAEFINYSKEITTKPKLFFLKNCIWFYQNLIDYHYTKKQTNYNHCKDAIKMFNSLGMREYGESTQRVLETYANK